MTDTYVKAGYIWQRNIRTVHSDGSATEGGFRAVREASLWEKLLYVLFKKAPSP